MSFLKMNVNAGTLIPLAGMAALAAAVLTVLVIHGEEGKTRSSFDPREREVRRPAGRTVTPSERARAGGRAGTGPRGRSLTMAEQREELSRIRSLGSDQAAQLGELWSLLPRLDEAAVQVEAAGFLASLLEDEEFEGEAGSYLLDPRRPRAVSETLILNLGERPPRVGKSLAETIVAMGDHPLHEHAVRMLQEVGDLER